jgi:hypothetical protein
MPVKLLARIARRRSVITDLNVADCARLFPSLGHLEPDGRHWRIQVHGEVFASGKISLGKRFLLKLLQRAMQVPQSEFASELFRARIDRFLAVDGKGKRVAVQFVDPVLLGEAVHVIPKRTRPNGHFFGTVRLPAELLKSPPVATEPVATGPTTLAAPTSDGKPRRIDLAVHRPDQGLPPMVSPVYLLPDRGVSVISDIDDTLKHSYVACKRTLLTNTFLRQFVPVPGMAELFRRWDSEGAAFHYVSSSPWQLYSHLAEHLSEQQFPEGSFHLRTFRLRDHLIRRILMLRRSGKAAVIRSILQTYPGRKFLLVGDSGELDPEIYGAMARKFPRQVIGIHIRQIAGPGNTPQRFARAFRGIPYEVVRLFREPDELGDIVLQAE